MTFGAQVYLAAGLYTSGSVDVYSLYADYRPGEALITPADITPDLCWCLYLSRIRKRKDAPCSSFISADRLVLK